MLHNCKTLENYKLDSLDGGIGRVRDFYFDDRHWTIRYLVADTGTWLRGRQVLISPHSLVAAIKDDKHIAVDLSKRQIEESPSLEEDQPVSRQFEEKYFSHHGWVGYWGGPLAWGIYPFPGAEAVAAPEPPDKVPGGSNGDPHLRSTHHVTGYQIEARDGSIGHVEDFIIDDVSWAVRYLVIDTKNWWPGRKVIVSPQWLEDISWTDAVIRFALTREEIKNAPEFTEQTLISREYEADLHGHYRREPYWASGEAAARS